jgi:lipopolysaccharide export system protein LptA
LEIPSPNMRSFLPALMLLQPCLHAEGNLQLPENSERVTSLLPNGSKLHQVMLPRYDENQRLSAVLKADVMTLVSGQVISGDRISVAFYNTDTSQRARLEMAHAVLDQSTGLLKAEDAVTLRGGRIEADGTGLVYHMQKSEGFLTGPVGTRIRANTETTMNQRRSTTRSAMALAGATMLATVSTAGAAPPAALTDAEKSAIAADAATAAPGQVQALEASRASLRDGLAAAAEATQAAAAFLDEAGMGGAASDSPVIQAPEAPLEIESAAGDTLINCDGGMYFDADAGILVYLKNVHVRDPRFDLSGANEVKIFLAKKPAAADPADTGEKKDKPGFGAGFGDVERVVATGAVRILQKQPEQGKQPVEASGAIFTYHPKTGEIVITGGYPWVKQGSSFMRAKQPNLSLRIHQSGSFVTEGNWEMGGRLNQNP